MKPTALLCFGGPLNEQVVTTDRVPLLAPIRDRLSARITDIGTAETYAPTIRTVCYDLQTFGFHDVTKCRVGFPEHGDWCQWSGPCLVAAGYPLERITDSLNAVIGIMSIWWGL